MLKNRKTELYALNWNIENTQLFSAIFGGPIGNLRALKIYLKNFNMI